MRVPSLPNHKVVFVRPPGCTDALGSMQVCFKAPLRSEAVTKAKRLMCKGGLGSFICQDDGTRADA